MLFRTCLIAALAFVMLPVAVAAPDKSDASATPDKSDASATPAEEFTKLYREFKEMVARLTQIQQKYANDPNVDKKALEQEYDSKVEQTKAMEVKVAAAAEKAYLADPNKEKDQSEFLFARLSKLVGNDDSEEASRLAKILVDHGFEHKFFEAVAGIAFFNDNDFENAEKHLKKAAAAGDLDTGVPVAALAKRAQGLIEKFNMKESWENEQKLRENADKHQHLPRVKLNTTKGDITVELFEDQAPIATNNFVNLVEKKFYDGLKFQRVIPNFMAQAGDPKGDNSGGPGYTIPDECFQDNHRNHFRGSLSMAHSSQRDSAGSQFFICFQPLPNLDGQYTVFGRVVEGFDVLAKLQRCQPGDVNTPDKILKATVRAKRNHKYEPSIKLPDKK
jgi:cyclophilin family peptidyl-prolyl cis-trans isomerase